MIIIREAVTAGMRGGGAANLMPKGRHSHGDPAHWIMYQMAIATKMVAIMAAA